MTDAPGSRAADPDAVEPRVAAPDAAEPNAVAEPRSAEPDLAGLVPGPRVTVDLAKIEANTRALMQATPGVEFVGVTKSTCGSPEVGRAMVAGGAQALGDSRLANLARLRSAGLGVPLWLLRPPAPDQAADCVRLADVSLASELETCEALAAAARTQGREHHVVAMVDLGDLREGMMPADLPVFLAAADALEGLAVHGVGVNLTCYGAVMPTAENLGELVKLAEAASRQLGRPLAVSGGNSGTLWRHLEGGGIPAGITDLRVGESIILGVDTMYRRPLPGLHTDAVLAAAPVVECLVKPSLPCGEVAQDAFGNRPTFTDRGERRRAICALGRQDAPPEGLTPTDPRVEVLGASSDHLILDVHAVEPPPRPGDLLTFTPNYAALLQLFTSPYVHKVFTPPA